MTSYFRNQSYDQKNQNHPNPESADDIQHKLLELCMLFVIGSNAVLKPKKIPTKAMIFLKIIYNDFLGKRLKLTGN